MRDQYDRSARLRLDPEFFSYTIAKSALWTATQTLAQALAPRIGSMRSAPGPVLPSLRQSQDDFERECRATPLGRRRHVEECAAPSASCSTALGDRTDDRARQRPAPCLGRSLGRKPRRAKPLKEVTLDQGLEAAGLKAKLTTIHVPREPDSARPRSFPRPQSLRGAETGPPVIARHAKTAPGGPGVYRMMMPPATCSMSARRAA